MTKVQLLNDTFSPTHYELALDINKEELSFTGSVTITGEMQKDTSNIQLHSKDLTIISVAINGAEATAAQQPDDILDLSADSITEGENEIILIFEGAITEQMHGIYPSHFKDGSATKRIISTQFESHHAREAFPCVDEPAAKATFDVQLTTNLSDTVLGNGEILASVERGDTKTTTFAKTPKMSTYLLAFAVGDLQSLEAVTSHGVTVRTWATPSNVEHTRFALDTAVATLDFYDDYFETPFPLQKLDMVAIPDFAAGAMENWGLVTYRESALLVDPDNTSIGNKQWVAMVVAHELAHQWFGNLVTMEWWTDLWLNEGFASWVEYLAVDHVYPEWDMWTQFVTDDFMRAQKLDSLASSHPIEVAIDHPDDIRGIFDAISYSKGASAIRMLQTYLGAEDFRKGLAYYLKKHEYGNASTKDLWAALEHVTKKPVSNFMSAWTSQTGFPVVNAIFTEETVKLTQRRYLVSPLERMTTKTNETWPVPINSSDVSEDYLLEKASAAWEIAAPSTTKLNKDQAGFYMVSYNKEHLDALAQHISAGNLPVVDRLGLLSDYLALSKAGDVSTIDTLQLLSHFKNESNAAVWDVITDVIGSIRRVMDTDEVREAIKPYVRTLVTSELKRLGFEAKETDSHFDKLLRPAILGLASGAEESSVVAWAKEQFETMHSPSDIPADVRGIVYGTVAREGGQAEYDKLLALHSETESAQEKGRLVAGLTNFSQPEIIKQWLSLIKTDEVRLQEISYWVAYSFMNRHSKTLAWEWLQENWEWIREKFGSDIMTFASFAKYPASTATDSAFADEFKTFFESAYTEGIQRQVAQAEETIRWQAAWKERDLTSIEAFFKQSS